MVGTTKRCIRKVLGKRQVDEKTNTILVSTEAAINSHPLTQDTSPLPARRPPIIPTRAEPTSTRSPTEEFRLKQQVTEDFLKRWTKKYLLELRTYHEV
jgi:hypothetical protein